MNSLELVVRAGERVALIGDNGTGKTTLLKILTGQESPDVGTIWRGPSVEWASLPQIVTFDHPERSLYDTLLYELDCSPQESRDRLASFGFRGDEVFDPVSTLSGGERSRLRLCLLMAGPVNFLLLDEPTNHLDIPSREWMESAVEGYEGGLLFVSHDRYFIAKFATRIWSLEGGIVTDYHGGYESYRIWRNKQASFPDPEQRYSSRKKSQSVRSKSARGTTPRETALRLEKDAVGLEAELTEVSAEMEQSAHNAEVLGALFQKQSEIQARLDEVYAEWVKAVESEHNVP